jgi:hypothetical protein
LEQSRAEVILSSFFDHVQCHDQTTSTSTTL